MADIAVEVSNRVPNGSVITTKPSYLITLENNLGKTKSLRYFITLDRPELLNGFVQDKGIFVDNDVTEEEIISKFSSLLTNSAKDLFLEVLLPWHKICSIRSLVFKAK